ncbi:hypothetical protein SAMN06265219_11337 [Gracilimonas mengyeensis]|uniref:DUF5683 domain-containing protein n=2 Tax=Gracilimonas mengyeensis TaxID=1302730 RepID=A0A521EQ57_9BACT|nr:hypothetical protein SAMN06265219_11337 [Gracilimonas mengyeensis]
MTLNAYLAYLTRLTSLSLLLMFLLNISVSAQHNLQHQSFVPATFSSISAAQDSIETYPDPKKVLKRSLFIPGWGQVTNKQIWKVPIVYGLLGGLAYYSVYLHKSYHDYRAAYYNSVYGAEGDYKFGPTPSFIPDNASTDLLRQNRNFYRNRRDLVYVFIGLSYALNAIDAYVFAHLRSFDVSDDLSLKATLKPSMLAANQYQPMPSISLSITF